MPDQFETENIFNIFCSHSGHIWVRKAFSILNGLLMKITGLKGLKELYLQIRTTPTPAAFADKILSRLEVQLNVKRDGLGRILKKGPLVVVANHPYGGVEAAALASMLLSVRRDVKFLANRMLSRAVELEELIFPVDPFHTRASTQFNLAAVKRAIQWVRSGGVLAIFPAGEVAHYQISKRQVTDPAWQDSMGQLVRKLKAPVLPVFFPGRNSALFQWAGLLHPRVRTVLLVREFLNKKGRNLSPCIGHPIPWDRLQGFSTARELMEYLRHRTFWLAAQNDLPRLLCRRISPPPVAPPLPGGELQKDIDALPPDQNLTRSGAMDVFFASYDQIPQVMQEIARLREVTFRAAGEGSGMALDLDDFDKTYTQLFIWNRQKREIAGAYRLGLTDRILNSQGKAGFYTSRLFAYPESLLENLSPAVELGRSFVSTGYQRSYLPLLLLWRGIGSLLARKPWVRYLFGAVSMSSSYHRLSRQLLVAHLTRNYSSTELARMVRGRNPAETESLGNELIGRLAPAISGLDELSNMIADLEPDEKGLPVLFRRYLELGGKILAFHLDPQFNNTLDGLILVDLPQANRRLLDLYMGKEEAAAYLSFHQLSGSKLEGGRKAGRKSLEWQPALFTT